MALRQLFKMDSCVTGRMGRLTMASFSNALGGGAALSGTAAPGSSPSYDQTLADIRAACGRIRIDFSTAGDGRLCSAADEDVYLPRLKSELGSSHVVVIPPARTWADIFIDDIPFNLKLSACESADNAFNRQAILFTLTGKKHGRTNLNFKDMWEHLTTVPWKAVRDKRTEYHYIAVNKQTGEALVKSILDIHTYVINAALSNVLQINWKNEFLHRDHAIADADFTEQGRKLVRACQEAVRRALANLTDFANAGF
jgi:hypothetical protein